MFPGEEEVAAAMVAAMANQRERRRGEEEYAVTRRWECCRTVKVGGSGLHNERGGVEEAAWAKLEADNKTRGGGWTT